MKLSGRLISLLCSAPLFYTGLLHAEDTSNTYFRTYWNPVMLGKPLAYCETPNSNCGKPVADAYCKTMGFNSAYEIRKAHNVGQSNYYAMRKTCVGWKCDGFKFIRCKGETPHDTPESYHYRLHKFAYPRYNKYRVDWCYEDNTGCGKRAADSFCRHVGYSEAKSFTKDDKVRATKAIGNQALCFGNECQGYSSIDCYR